MVHFLRLDRTKILIVVSFTLSLLASMFAPAGLASPLDDKRRALKSVQSRIGATKGALSAAKKRQAEVYHEINLNDQKISQLQTEISSLEAELQTSIAKRKVVEEELSKALARLQATQVELSDAQKKLDYQHHAYDKRMRGIYKNGRASLLAVLLNSEDLGELIERTIFTNMIAENDAKLVYEMKTTKRAILEKLTQIESEKKKIAKNRLILLDEEHHLTVVKTKIANRQTLFKNELARQQRILANLKKEKIRLVNLEDILESNSTIIAKQIRDLERGGRVGVSRGSIRGASNGRFIRPCSGSMTSKFGWRFHPVLKYSRLHAGIDFGVGTGTPIYAAQGGTVILAGGKGGYGNTVVISHGGGVSTLYAHNSRLVVRTGQHVSQGQIVSYSGSTGLSTGPHLHFEVRVNGVPKNPMNWL